MQKPAITSMFQMKTVLETESKIQFVDTKGGRSYQTISFPAGTEVIIYVSKYPLPSEEKS